MTKSYASQAIDGFEHSNLYFGSKQEAENYNAALVRQGFFEPGSLSVGEMVNPVNAKFDGKAITLLADADDEAQDEAGGENEALKAAE